NFRNMEPKRIVFSGLRLTHPSPYYRTAQHVLGKFGILGPATTAVEVLGNIPATKPDSASAIRQERSSVFIRGAPSFLMFSTVFLGKLRPYPDNSQTEH